MIREFGINKHGEQAHLLTLENDKYYVELTDCGAALVSYVLKETGTDICQGFPCAEGHDKGGSHGASVGRVCNRIRDKKFTLNGREYVIESGKPGRHLLHCGIYSLAHRMYSYEEQPGKVIFHITVKDGEGGFPGEADIAVTYALSEEGLTWSYTGTAKSDTLISMTNHAYFNLDGYMSESVLDHKLQVFADEFLEVDDEQMMTGTVLNVRGTPFDFREPKQIGEDLGSNDVQLKNGLGYDHHFIIPGTGMRKHAELTNGILKLTVFSDHPGVQVYSGNQLTGNYNFGKGGARFPYRSAVCLETQYVPNAINCEDFEKPIVRAGETVTHTTLFALEKI